MCADQTSLEGKGDKRIEADAKAIAYELDPHAVVDRAVRAEPNARVTVRPAPDSMTYVTALLPMPQGVAVYAALQARSRHLRRRPRPRPGHGRHPRRTRHRPPRRRPGPRRRRPRHHRRDPARRRPRPPPGSPATDRSPPRSRATWSADAVDDDRSRATLRRLYRHPDSGALVAMESRARLLPQGAGRGSSTLRDDTCRTPYCDAPIRHHDHATPTAAADRPAPLNGLGAVRSVQLRQGSTRLAGHHRPSTKPARHTAEFTTPTGATHTASEPHHYPAGTTPSLVQRHRRPHGIDARPTHAA